MDLRDRASDSEAFGMVEPGGSTASRMSHRKISLEQAYSVASRMRLQFQPHAPADPPAWPPNRRMA